MVNVHSGGRTKVRAKKIIITIISVLAVIGITIGASNAFDVKAKTTYEDIEIDQTMAPPAVTPRP